MDTVSIFPGNGEIDFKEFLTMMSRKVKSVEGDDSLRECFNVFDKNGDGYITKEELHLVMKNLGESLCDEDVMEMLAQADLNGDGLVDYEGEM